MLITIYWRLKFDAYAFPRNQIFFFIDNILRTFSSHFLLLTCFYHVHKKYNARLSNNLLIKQNIKVEYPFSYRYLSKLFAEQCILKVTHIESQRIEHSQQCMNATVYRKRKKFWMQKFYL